jgi:hypothetical protein
MVAILGGCGKKGPPVPPKSPALPQVTSLEGHLDGDTVHLSWRLGEAVQGGKEYVILRSQVDPAKPLCDGCPRIFQRVGTIAMAPEAGTLRFSEVTAPGFVYTYKVQPIGTSGEPGPESNGVTIDRSVHPGP